MAHSPRRAPSRMPARSLGLAGSVWAVLPCVTALLGAPAVAGDSAPPTDGPAEKADAPNEQVEKEIRPCVMLVPDGGVAGHFQTNLWPFGQVRYTFASDVTEANKKRVFDAMNELESVCGVRFLLHIPGITVNRVVFRNANTNSSYVGMIGGAQPINLFNWEHHYIIVHEIMHALGFRHEHQRADRDVYVTVQQSNIVSGWEFNFTLLDGVSGGQCPTMAGSYDFDSVMHYGACALSTCTSCSSDNDDCTTIVVNEPW